MIPAALSCKSWGALAREPSEQLGTSDRQEDSKTGMGEDLLVRPQKAKWAKKSSLYGRSGQNKVVPVWTWGFRTYMQTVVYICMC